MTFSFKDWLDRIHWEQALVLCVMIICMTGAPVLFFVMVPPEVLTILVGLPWLTILGPGLTAVLAALAALKAFFGPSVIRPKIEAQPSTKVSETVKVEVEHDDTHEVG